MSNEQAGALLELSERQIRRLRRGMEEKGTDALKHGNTGKTPSTAISTEQRREVVRLYKSKYIGANFQHFTELLEEHEDICISVMSVTRILKSEGIQSPKKRRKSKQHRRRQRKGYAGELVQTDATAHDFFGTGEKVCLHGAIDDATGDVTGLYMVKHECLDGYFGVFEQMIKNFGIPGSMYADRHTIFASPKASKLTIEDELAGKTANDTQLGRAMRELGITLIWARSPQAKGRIERLWATLQDRLVIEFRINRITTIEAANEFLPGFIKRYNKKFGVEAFEETSLFLPNHLDLINILCVREERTIDPGGAFSFYGQTFVITVSIHPGTRIEVIAHRKFGIFALYNDRRYDVCRIDKPKHKKAAPTPKERTTYSPPDSNYHKRGKEIYTHYSGEYTDTEMLMILDEIFTKSFK
jgi:transposase